MWNHKSMEAIIEVPDDILAAAKLEAEHRGTTLGNFISEILKERVEKLRADEQTVGSERAAMIAALSQGRNIEPVGRLRREELHERPVLH